MKMRQLFFITAALLALYCPQTWSKSAPPTGYQSFEGHQVIRAVAKNIDQGMALIDLQKAHPTLDFWKEPSINDNTDFLVPSKKLYFMQPWGYTSNPPEDYDEVQAVADFVASNITALYGTRYSTGSSSTTIYPTDGTSQDWAKGSGIFKFVYTAELRDTGNYGFLLPPTLIMPTAQETWAGFKVVCRHIIGL